MLVAGHAAGVAGHAGLLLVMLGVFVCACVFFAAPQRGN